LAFFCTSRSAYGRHEQGQSQRSLSRAASPLEAQEEESEERTHLVSSLLRGSSSRLSLGELLGLLLLLGLLRRVELRRDAGTAATLGLAGGLLGGAELLDARVERETLVDEGAAARVVLLLLAVALRLVLLLLVALLVTAAGGERERERKERFGKGGREESGSAR